MSGRDRLNCPFRVDNEGDLWNCNGGQCEFWIHDTDCCTFEASARRLENIGNSLEGIRDVFEEMRNLYVGRMPGGGQKEEPNG